MNEDLETSGTDVKNPEPMVEKKTVSEFLKQQENTASLLTETSGRKPVSVIILCDGPTSFDRKALGAVPHVVLDLEDDLFRKIRDLQEENLRLQSLSVLDNLTGLYNNRFFRSQLEKEMARTKRTGHPCSLLMIDLDNFKVLNDTLGHLEGDGFLVKFGRVMHDNARATDLIYRYGGDEFAVIMPATSATEAVKTAERFKKRLAELSQKTSPAISLSMGISEYTFYSSYDMNDFIQAADFAMYEAKRGGKDRICVEKRLEESGSLFSEVNPDEKAFLLKGYP
ncbi:MAG: GGDEF domain-containing protein [Deltaproteobacteria bacterium]|nr:GGDEF domain-containing protein [Deltaproteobacteria bacterium]